LRKAELRAAQAARHEWRQISDPDDAVTAREAAVARIEDAKTRVHALTVAMDEAGDRLAQAIGGYRDE
jgi:hypothetical protein